MENTVILNRPSDRFFDHMNNNTTRDTKKTYMSLAAISVVLLLSAALVVPSLNAYATNGHGTDKANFTNSHQKDRKDKIEDKIEQKINQHCEKQFGKYGKYSKICRILNKIEDKREGNNNNN